MTPILLCVLAAALMPIVCACIAKRSGFGKPRRDGGFDNHVPREWRSRPACRRAPMRPRPIAEDLKWMGFPIIEKGQIELRRGKGCHHCRGTGYSGRCAIFEIFPMSDQMKKLVSAKASDAELRQVAVREGMTTLREDPWAKVRKGVTTVEEALRVTSDI